MYVHCMCIVNYFKIPKQTHLAQNKNTNKKQQQQQFNYNLCFNTKYRKNKNPGVLSMHFMYLWKIMKRGCLSACQNKYIYIFYFIVFVV